MMIVVGGFVVVFAVVESKQKSAQTQRSSKTNTSMLTKTSEQNFAEFTV